MIRILLCLLALALPTSAQEAPNPTGETIVAGLSQNLIAITTNFTGSEILIYGAVRREQPIPGGAPLEVIATVQGPSGPLTVRRKERKFGIWMNTDAVTISRAPTFYAIASSAPLSEALSETENLRHEVTIPSAIRAVGISAEAEDAPVFLDALIRLRREQNNYVLSEKTVKLLESTLFRADVALPANLTEGEYRVRLFITRDGVVIDKHEEIISVNKDGLERWIYNLAHEQPLIYGLLSLLLAVAAGWGASAAFGLLRR
ncbi:TIGR02186 family protein [Pseudorhodobacter ferrugineus]|uniref:TIGR02186 family protein n=1 Tax=Pseudorhodobacter ferrugineus TaxID=77008 RepID=UPI0003B5F8FD|nr:TIGR02186 family protein [Pseudorhodobacter ferrugineus]